MLLTLRAVDAVQNSCPAILSLAHWTKGPCFPSHAETRSETQLRRWYLVASCFLEPCSRDCNAKGASPCDSREANFAIAKVYERAKLRVPWLLRDSDVSRADELCESCPSPLFCTSLSAGIFSFK